MSSKMRFQKLNENESFEDLPPHWIKKESKTRKGKFFYAHTKLRIVKWGPPSFIACDDKICVKCTQYYKKLNSNTNLNNNNNLHNDENLPHNSEKTVKGTSSKTRKCTFRNLKSSKPNQKFTDAQSPVKPNVAGPKSNKHITVKIKNAIINKYKKNKYTFKNNLQAPNDDSLVIKASQTEKRSLERTSQKVLCKKIKTDVTDDKHNLSTNDSQPCVIHSTKYELPPVEEMDIDLVEEINSVRKEFNQGRPALAIQCSQPLDMVELCDRNDLFYVIDTNVMIEALGSLNLLSGIHGKHKIHLVIPYVVVQELDGLKNSEKAALAKSARDGLRWCHEKLNPSISSMETCIWGQSLQNHNDNVNHYGGKIGDDRIRDFCLYLQDKGMNVVLLTNDIGLKTKLYLSNIKNVCTKDVFKNCQHKLRGSSESCNEQDNCSVCLPFVTTKTTNTILESSVLPPERNFVDPAPSCSSNMSDLRKSEVKDSQVSKRISEKSVCTTLGNVLQTIMKDAFGDIWLNVVRHKPPWSLLEVLECWKHHWLAIHMGVLPDTSQSYLLKMLSLVKKNETNSKDFEDAVLQLYADFRKRGFYIDEEKITDHSTDLGVCGSSGQSATSNDVESSQSLSEGMICSSPIKCNHFNSFTEEGTESSAIAKEAIIKAGSKISELVNACASDVDRANYECSISERQNFVHSMTQLSNCVHLMIDAFSRVSSADLPRQQAAQNICEVLDLFWDNASTEPKLLCSDVCKMSMNVLVSDATQANFFEQCVRELSILFNEVKNMILKVPL